MAHRIAVASGSPQPLGHNWVPRFLARHPDIHSKIEKKLDALRAKNTTISQLKEYFDRLKRIIKMHNIAPENIWNIDETGLGLGVCNNQIVIRTSKTNQIYNSTPESREWVTIIKIISVNGHYIKPLIIFTGSDL